MTGRAQACDSASDRARSQAHRVHLGHAGSPDAQERLSGYKRALSEAGIAYDAKLVVPGDWHEEGGADATLRLLASKIPFTALFCVNDQTAYGACLALHRSGSMCREIFPSWASTTCIPRISSASFDDGAPVHSLARRALGRGDVVLLKGERPRVALPEVELVVRESTAVPSASRR
jgi:LacI family transcriptional regulator